MRPTKDGAAPITGSFRRPSRAPRTLSILFRLLAVAIPASVLFVTVRASDAELARSLDVPAPAAFGVLTRIAVVTLALTPSLATSFALEALRCCALFIRRGRALTLDVARALRVAASWMLASSVAALIAPTIAGLLLSASSGKLTLGLHLGAGVVLPGAFSGALFLLSGVIVEAATLADDHAQIV